jgi:hypothetical protein
MFSVAFIVIGMFSPEILLAQDPPTGTCCPSNTGAMCVIAGHPPYLNRYYKSEGDCPPLEECWVGDPECGINTQQ